MHRLPRSSFAGRPCGVVVLVALLLGVPVPLLGPLPAPRSSGAVARGVDGTAASVVSPAPPERNWMWPAAGPRTVVAPFRAPAHAYGPGHRGIDLAASGELRAPADGLVAFAGTVVDRPLLTIDHGDGVVTTFEPVASELTAGTSVHRGDVIARMSAGGHAPPGALHLGVRWNGAYINPMLLFGGVPRAVLLPCGAGGC